MSMQFSFVLVVCAVGVFIYILKKIRKSEITIADSTFWFLFAASIVLLAAFPQIAYFFSGLLQIQSPSNFVFLYVIAVLVVREFFVAVEISKLRARVVTLTQQRALEGFEERKKGSSADDE
ncbi:MAG: DUF2304 domain-containing protein [Eggerthellaceae bacterium]|nr:DUF2304 domain-containing protein [Eggerthellaceae bacterium]